MRVLWLFTFFPLVGCGVMGSSPFRCPAGTHPCGNGCIPTMAVCCDDGNKKTSSFCTNGATGCSPNASRGCQAVFPSGTTAQFCCGSTGTFGSNDCPDGQHHCGTLCQPVDVPCCPSGSSSEDCPERSWSSASCSNPPGEVGCGICVKTNVCISCPPGSCCQGGVVCGGAGARCIPGSACTGERTGSGAGGGGGASCPMSRCGPASGGMKLAGQYVPRSCGCPAGTISRADWGGYSNSQCGLPGAGADCIYCSCPD
ncbi:MAG: hypothetical protein Q8N26_05720 [Myxococcales bacterium]|nr:hypothetical protein [Myxococcales bacterium]